MPSTNCNCESSTGQVNIRPISQEELNANAKNFPLVPPSHKPNVDRVFLRQLLTILRIAFPSWRSKEVFILILHSTFLVLRTVLSVAVARLDGRIVRDLVCCPTATHHVSAYSIYRSALTAKDSSKESDCGLHLQFQVPTLIPWCVPRFTRQPPPSLTLSSSYGISNQNCH